jgi:uncharacterized protein (DUF58 family)
MPSNLGARIRRKILSEPGHVSMWKNFLKAMAFLGVAMFSALYSAGAGRDGNIIAAAVSAFFALGIALWVGLRFVPRLARGVDWDWLPIFSGYRVTRDGWVYFAAVAVVISAAVNTNNNLLYMVLAALLAVLLLSGFLAAVNLRGIVFDARLPSGCFAGEEFPVSIALHNRKRVFPTFSLTVEALGVGAFKGASPVTVTKDQPPVYLSLARPGSTIGETRMACCARRGRYAIGEIRITSRYPFGFLSRERRYPASGEGVAFPAILPPERGRLGVPDVHGVSHRFERGFGYELHAIRDYISSDSARSVHWKASAKTAVLKTREYAVDEDRRVLVAFDRFGEPPQAEAFEALVSRAASLVFHLMRDGVEVAFISDDWRTQGGISESLLESILTYLALVEMSADASPPNAPHVGGVLELSLRGGAG